MSLIIEALKKARDDAVRRQAAARGLPLAPVPKLESRSRWLSLALIPLAAALVICVMLLIDAYSRVPDSAGPQMNTQQSASNGQSSGDNPVLQVSPHIDDATPENEAVSARSTPPTIQSERPPVRSPSGSTPEKAGLEVTPSAGSVTPAGQAPRTDSATSAPATDGTRDSRIYTGQAKIQDGQLLDLGGTHDLATERVRELGIQADRVVGINADEARCAVE